MSPQGSDIVSALQLAGLMVGLVAAATALLQRRLSPAYGVSALMFLAFSLTYLIHLARAFVPGLPLDILHAIHMLSYSASFFVVPAFLFQVMLLTDSKRYITAAEVRPHMILPAIAIAVASLSIWTPADALARIYGGAGLGGEALWIQTSIAALLILEPVVYLQWFVYVGLIFRIQLCRRSQLKSVFASDERSEVVWVSAMAAVLGIYAIGCLASFAARIAGQSAVMGPVLDSALVLLFMLLAAIHGLRQAPGLYNEHRLSPKDSDAAGAKYSKSALAAEHAERIARKLHAAMATDHLFRDANLSLSKLSQHIGSSSNYVSQTLNEHVDQSFFDFVNAWRISEAKDALLNGDDTILQIAYDVGFNSRSAFYAAFKRHVGMTPSEFRASRVAAVPSAAETLPFKQTASR
ncbi:MAG: helix-turn-helix transcriptional regulator [Pseudomonadota bacterium]